MKTSELANTLRESAAADIWYDADRFFDAPKIRQIDEAQDAMYDAAKIIETMPEIGKLLREMVAAIQFGDAEFSPSGDWFREAEAAIAKMEEFQ